MENITEVLMESIAKAEKMIAAEEPAPGDYRKDGLLYCGKCHTPKEFRGKFLGMVKVKSGRRVSGSIAVPASLKAICRIGTLQLMTVRTRA